MKKITYGIGLALYMALASCAGGGDTGESYNSTKKSDLNPNPNAGLTDTVSVVPVPGTDTGMPPVPPSATDTATTNVNRSGAR
ncbi:hypothetical protein [Polluticoccus soli]|uniref:hypothetical protein n=1 Tax=Polluticoccus soli TaxID=3034150 RepID=UPI0023E0FB05|nr:hypothetical protein [Flavipsychrobacter sp. JY13-12]